MRGTDQTHRFETAPPNRSGLRRAVAVAARAYFTPYSARLTRCPALLADRACGSKVLPDSMLFAFALYERKNEQRNKKEWHFDAGRKIAECVSRLTYQYKSG